MADVDKTDWMYWFTLQDCGILYLHWEIKQNKFRQQIVLTSVYFSGYIQSVYR